MYHLNWDQFAQVKPTLNSGGDSLTLTTKPKCDFWRTPHRMVMDGSFGYETIEGDFLISVHITGKYKDQYDQAGLMIYLGDDYWLKAGIELINGIQYVSAVITQPYSDWSVVPTNLLGEGQEKDGLNLRIERKGSKILIDYYFDSQVGQNNNESNLTENELPWIMLRKVTGFLDGISQPIKVGLVAASPQSDTGFSVVFSDYNVVRL